MTDGRIECPGGCDETYDAETWENESMWSPIIEEMVCAGCYENDGNYVSTLLRFAPDGEHQRVLLGDLTLYTGTLDEIYDTEIPDWLADLFPDGKPKRNYVRTDGWRGHQDTPAVMTGIRKIADGWTTGDWGDAVSDRKAPTRDLGEFLVEEGNEPPRPLFVILEPTSNVFSMSMDIFTADGDYDTVVAWLADNGYPAADLERALG